MKKFFVILIIFCTGLLSCSKSPEKEAAEIERTAKVLAKAADIQIEMKKYRTAELDIKYIATTLVLYSVDKGAFPSITYPSDNLLTDQSSYYGMLYPHYSSSLPVQDPWGFPYEIYFGKDCERFYGLKSNDPTDYLIISTGIHKRHEKWTYDPVNTQAGLYEEFDENKNIVNFNGEMIRGLKK